MSRKQRPTCATIVSLVAAALTGTPILPAAHAQQQPVSHDGGDGFVDRWGKAQVSVDSRFVTIEDSFFERIGIDFDFDFDDDRREHDDEWWLFGNSDNPDSGRETASGDDAGQETDQPTSTLQLMTDPILIIDGEGVVVDVDAARSRSNNADRSPATLELMVMPRIVIQEEEEER